MENFVKQAYYAGAEAALRDMGISKTAAGLGFLEGLGRHASDALFELSKVPNAAGKFREGRIPNAMRSVSDWALEHPTAAGGGILGAGALGAGAAGYALAPDQKPWYHFGQ